MRFGAIPASGTDQACKQNLKISYTDLEAMKPEILVVCGPTATGKTRLGIALAERYGGEIVSADSMQVYRRIIVALQALTACP